MSTKKDLVEAHAFSRRRLVTAFVSGAPGGREVEPSRPGRTIVGGVALGVLVLAGGAIAGIFSGRPPDGWLDPGIVIEKETGNTYVITEESDDPVLRPVIGNINARLIFGPEQEPASVSSEDIAGQTIGDDIGILGAPAVLPSVDQLVADGWVACTADGVGTVVDVSSTPQASPAPDDALVVRTEIGDDEEYWLVATGELDDDPADQAFRYRLPSNAGTRDLMLGLLELPLSDEVPTVGEEWINLWPRGESLDRGSFETGEGRVPESTDWFPGLDEPATAGDVVEARDRTYLVTQDGPASLRGFDAAVYNALADEPEPLAADDITRGETTATPDGWPDDVPEAVDDGSVCAMLVPRDDQEPPTVLVADSPGDALDPVDAEVPAGEPEVSVEPGYGAFVVSGSFGLGVGATPFVIDSKGVRYEVEGADAIVNLGYADAEPRVVPDSWLTPFECGVVLSRNAALSPPSAENLSSCEDEE